LAAAFRPGKIVIDTTTGDSEATAALARRLAAKGVEYIDAPLSAGNAAAAEGIWSRYFSRLVRLARRPTRGISRSVADERGRGALGRTDGRLWDPWYPGTGLCLASLRWEAAMEKSPTFRKEVDQISRTLRKTSVNRV
jgi:hypothetical protein